MTSKVAMATFGVGLVLRVGWVLAAKEKRKHNTTRRHFGSTTISPSQACFVEQTLVQ